MADARVIMEEYDAVASGACVIMEEYDAVVSGEAPILKSSLAPVPRCFESCRMERKGQEIQPQ